MQTNITNPTRRAMLGAIGISATAIAMGAKAATTTATTETSIELTALIEAEHRAAKACADYDDNVFTPIAKRWRIAVNGNHKTSEARQLALSCGLDAAREESDRLNNAAVAAIDAVADYPATTLADLHTKTQLLISHGYFDVSGIPEKIAADIARLAAREA